MPRSRPVRYADPVRRSDRHGRGARGPVTGPHLPLLQDRIDVFEMAVAATADFLKGVWPEQLADMRVQIAAAPSSALGFDEVERWGVDPANKAIILYRVPIERLAKLHRNDDLHRKLLVESCVFRAVAELLGKDPWDLAPGRFGHY
ncbi:metallopeptidase family protein [Humibacter sp. RRB41]|uniref:metallopeptidase family protein n=1 Tax=Humibacter sp. RRB41 TaxID=2919946 RepID=UPI001FA9CC02|nr:metallopeptidase family protein [Humibacter sp. RRB41]